MKRIIAPVILAILLIPAPAQSNEAVETAQKIVAPDWLSRTALKWGFVSSFCAYQALNGITEGYHFTQETRHIATGENYHAYASAQRIA